MPVHGTPAKNIPYGLAKDLLYCSMIEPQWTKLPRTVKHALCKLMRKSYNNIHDPNFYTALHTMWYTNRMFQEKVMREHNTPRFDCSICFETVPLRPQGRHCEGRDQIKVTTLMCGHNFCSQCIFKHIDCRIHTDGNTSCPMCRANVFKPPVIVPGVQEDLEVTNKKRIRRQQERWTKRQRIKLEREIEHPLQT
jgi:hypothetical protein